MLIDKKIAKQANRYKILECGFSMISINHQFIQMLEYHAKPLKLLGSHYH